MKSWTDRSETTARILGWSGLKEQDMQLPGFIAKAAIGVAFLVFAPMFRAQPANIASEYSPVLGTQQQGSISITDPAESNTYRMAVSQADPKVRAAGLEGFLTAYPQSVAKRIVLGTLLDTYTSMGEADQVIRTGDRLLQVDPSNLKAIYTSVTIKNSQCEKNQDAEACNDAAVLARRGLGAMKGAGVSNADWDLVFRSAIIKAVGTTRQPQMCPNPFSNPPTEGSVESPPLVLSSPAARYCAPTQQDGTNSLLLFKVNPGVTHIDFIARFLSPAQIPIDKVVQSLDFKKDSSLTWRNISVYTVWKLSGYCENKEISGGAVFKASPDMKRFNMILEGPNSLYSGSCFATENEALQYLKRLNR
jgi:hypothetical protein